MDDEIPRAARATAREFELDGTWARLRQDMQVRFPDWCHERRFLLRSESEDGVEWTPVVWVGNEPWTLEKGGEWMERLWQCQRASGAPLSTICDLDANTLLRGDPSLPTTEAHRIRTAVSYQQPASDEGEVGEVQTAQA